MVYVWEFEFFDANGYVDALPCAPFDGGTFGDTLSDAVESAADWLGCMVDEYLMGNCDLPPMEFGHRPEHGGHIIAVAVERKLEDVPAMTAADAARELGISTARVAQLVKAGLLDSWKDGSKRMVSRASVEARKECGAKPGRPRACEKAPAA